MRLFTMHQARAAATAIAIPVGFILVVGGLMSWNDTTRREARARMTPAERAAGAAERAARRQAEAARPAGRAGQRAILARLRDPDSFQLVAAKLVPATGTICYEYRARNGFGGMNVGAAIYHPSTYLQMRQDTPAGFAEDWRAKCSDAGILLDL